MEERDVQSGQLGQSFSMLVSFTIIIIIINWAYVFPIESEARHEDLM